MPSRIDDREQVTRPQEDRYREFAEHYTLCWNATEAYEKCSWTKTKNARVNQSSGSSMLKNKSVQRHIAAVIAERRKRYEVTVDGVIMEQARIAFSDMRNYIEWRDGEIKLKESAMLDADAARAVETLEVRTRETPYGDKTTTYKVKLWNKSAALESLCKYLGLYTEKHDVRVTYGTVNVPALAETKDWMDVVRQEISHVNGSNGATKTDMDGE